MASVEVRRAGGEERLMSREGRTDDKECKGIERRRISEPKGRKAKRENDI